MGNTLIWQARGGAVVERSATKLNVQGSNPGWLDDAVETAIQTGIYIFV